VDLTDGLRELYISPGDPLRSEVRKRHNKYLASKGGTRSRDLANKHSSIYPEQVRKYEYSAH
jgi:hypothetical protein